MEAVERAGGRTGVRGKRGARLLPSVRVRLETVIGNSGRTVTVTPAPVVAGKNGPTSEKLCGKLISKGGRPGQFQSLSMSDPNWSMEVVQLPSSPLSHGRTV